MEERLGQFEKPTRAQTPRFGKENPEKNFWNGEAFAGSVTNAWRIRKNEVLESAYIRNRTSMKQSELRDYNG